MRKPCDEMMMAICRLDLMIIKGIIRDPSEVQIKG
jgi:hypothetical protein